MVGNVDNWGGYVCIRTISIWEISVLSPHFFYVLKISLKNAIYFFFKGGNHWWTSPNLASLIKKALAFPESRDFWLH